MSDELNRQVVALREQLVAQQRQLSGQPPLREITIAGKAVPSVDGATKSHRKRKRPAAAAIISFVKFVGLVGTMIFLVADFVEDLSMRHEYGDKINQLRGSGKLLDFDSVMAQLQHNTDDYTEHERHRLLAILKTRWPECVDNKLTSQECKDLIDADIQTLFTDEDRNITTHIIRTRTVHDVTYNLVVIRTGGSGGRVRGVWEDGMVYYDFEWNSTGIEATESQETDIPPVNGQNVQGITIDAYISGNATEYIAGGTYQPHYTNSVESQAKLDSYISTPETIRSAGVRTLGPWDCSGLTGVSCCAMIKHSVRDADTKGNAVQCWIEELGGAGGPTVTRKTCEDDITKVCIYENHEGLISKVPILAYDRVIDEAIAGGYDITASE